MAPPNDTYVALPSIDWLGTDTTLNSKGDGSLYNSTEGIPLLPITQSDSEAYHAFIKQLNRYHGNAKQQWEQFAAVDRNLATLTERLTTESTSAAKNYYSGLICLNPRIPDHYFTHTMGQSRQQLAERYFAKCLENIEPNALTPERSHEDHRYMTQQIQFQLGRLYFELAKLDESVVQASYLQVASSYFEFAEQAPKLNLACQFFSGECFYHAQLNKNASNEQRENWVKNAENYYQSVLQHTAADNPYLNLARLRLGQINNPVSTRSFQPDNVKGASKATIQATRANFAATCLGRALEQWQSQQVKTTETSLYISLCRAELEELAASTHNGIASYYLGIDNYQRSTEEESKATDQHVSYQEAARKHFASAARQLNKTIPDTNTGVNRNITVTNSTLYLERLAQHPLVKQDNGLQQQVSASQAHIPQATCHRSSPIVSRASAQLRRQQQGIRTRDTTPPLVRATSAPDCLLFKRAELDTSHRGVIPFALDGLGPNPQLVRQPSTLRQSHSESSVTSLSGTDRTEPGASRQFNQPCR